MEKEEIVSVLKPLLDEFKSQIIRELKDHIDGIGRRSSAVVQGSNDKSDPWFDEFLARWDEKVARVRIERDEQNAKLARIMADIEAVK